MLTLYGTATSNYYNKVKMALLEKQLEFEEVEVRAGSRDEEVLAMSPLGKIPFLKTDAGCLCESQVMLEYIEALQPQPPLLPRDAFSAAKVRELSTFIDWQLEMSARQLYGAAFFGAAPLSESNAGRIRKELTQRIEGFGRLARFGPYVAGDSFSLADCSAFNSMPLVAMASKAIFGEDLLLAGGVDHKAYARLIGERPSAQRVVADRKAAQSRR